MSASFYSTIDTNSRERISLAPGSYGTSKQAGLKIVAYIEKASKNDKAGNMRHSFLVSATRPSREQLQATKNGNGKSSAAGDHPLDAPDFEGTAFLSLTLSEAWTSPESIALSFTEQSRNKEGNITRDYVAAAIAAGAVTEKSVQACRIHYQKLATDKVVNANTPEDSMAEAVKNQYGKELFQAFKKVHDLFLLQDWKNGGDKDKRDPNQHPMELVGVEFSGRVEKSNVGDQSEVTGIWSRS